MQETSDDEGSPLLVTLYCISFNVTRRVRPSSSHCLFLQRDEKGMPLLIALLYGLSMQNDNVSFNTTQEGGSLLRCFMSFQCNARNSSLSTLNTHILSCNNF